MATYRLLVENRAQTLLERVEASGDPLRRDLAAALAEYPYPGQDEWNKTRLVVDGESVFRLTVRDTYVAYYDVVEDEKAVRILDLLPGREAEGRYGMGT